MTPGNIAALVEDNARDYLRHLTREQRNSSQLHGQHLALQARILCALYDIADDAFEAGQIRQILEQRQAREAQGFARLDALNGEFDTALKAYRDDQARQVAEHRSALDEQHEQPDMRQCHQALQEAQERRAAIAGEHELLLGECMSKLAVYDQHPLYAYLRKHQYGASDYTRNTLWQRMDAWLARQCNYLANQQNEQLLRAMLVQDAARLAEHDAQVATLAQRLADLRKRALPARGQASAGAQDDVLANRIVTLCSEGSTALRDIERLETCADDDSEDALRWLRFELKTPTLTQALAQWAAIGAHQATRYQQELDSLRQRLDEASQRVEQARRLLEQATTLEVELRRTLHDQQRCASGCNCPCHVRPLEGLCACQLRYPLDDRYADTLDYRQLIADFMNARLPLASLVTTLQAQRLDNGTARAPLSDRPLMQGHP
ncbi:hypothetical protein P0Y43_06630 [Pseudomonas entomophila]|uniref:hypothetical protein n=1 Tax=Pseudomonas entomophila TaxID=312306 RepID=UPI0023D80835|nr:hypothetical protein [Pseudomonas entomophila]MDF0730406.1 hypothetical protein [Pseudomonas entomophila]